MGTAEIGEAAAKVTGGDPLRHALAAMRIEAEGAALGFADRLARENGWSAEHAAEVVEEYRRFLYLAAQGPVTPFDAVDQAWHLHLTYTRHYWEVLYGTILPRPLHHMPTAGGPEQAAHWRARYAATLDAYRATFGVAPPPAIWPGPDARFAGRMRRIDAAAHWIVPRPPARLAVPLAALPLLAACGTMTGEQTFLAVVVTAGMAGALGAKALGLTTRRDRRDGSGCGGGSCGSDNGGGGGCGGGCGGD